VDPVAFDARRGVWIAVADEGGAVRARLVLPVDGGVAPRAREGNGAAGFREQRPALGIGEPPSRVGVVAVRAHRRLLVPRPEHRVVNSIRELLDLVLVAGLARPALGERVGADSLVLHLRVRILRVLGVAGRAIEPARAVHGRLPTRGVDRRGPALPAPEEELLVGRE
jgi:hypothetical protein